MSRVGDSHRVWVAPCSASPLPSFTPESYHPPTADRFEAKSGPESELPAFEFTVDGSQISGLFAGRFAKCVAGTVLGASLLLGGCASPTHMGGVPIAGVQMMTSDKKGEPAGVADAALYLVGRYGDVYMEKNAWVNLDPHHALPANEPIALTEGRSKCNLFALQALALGGFEPPRWGNGPSGEYANANQVWKWSDVSAAQFGNPVRFTQVGHLEPKNALDPRAEVKALLRQAEPGDLVSVDYGPKNGSDERVVNRGHLRVVLDNPLARGRGHVTIAHARDLQGAVVGRLDPDELTGVAQVWVLRPSVPSP